MPWIEEWQVLSLKKIKIEKNVFMGQRISMEFSVP